MGIGSFLTKYLNRNIILTFIQVELLIGLIGGSSAAILFLLFDQVNNFRIPLYALVVITGILVGLEIPLLMRILKDRLEFKDLVSKVFSFDYIGALLASLLFPLILVPYLGLIKASFLFGLLNVLVALWTIHLFRQDLPWLRSLQFMAVTAAIFLTSGIAFSEKIMSASESIAYSEPVIYSTSTPYQRIVVTSNGKGMKLFLNGNLQFNSRDEYRYHEALIHPGMASLQVRKNVLVLGGGDGMAVREILKYPDVENITLVDLDSAMTDMFKEQSVFRSLNKDSLNNKKVKIINEDAFAWLRQCQQKFDFIVIDFPDPSNYSLGKLYSDRFYKEVAHALNDQGLMVIQSTSPYYAKNSYWCVVNTLNSIGLQVAPYHAYVPSFGDWGYVIASKSPFKQANHYLPDLRYISTDATNQMFVFPKDMQPDAAYVNKLHTQKLVHLFESEWADYVETH
jgi:spermidine synthase